MVVFEKTKGLTNNELHYCPGCTHGIIHRLVAEALEELGVKSLGELTDEQFDDLRKKFGNQKLMGLDYSCGGHLTHGYRMNVSARMFESHPYGVDKETGLLDYDAIEKQAMEVKPLILLTGYSAYPRKINFKRFREIADKCGAVLMVDMAHFAGLVAGKVFEEVKKTGAKVVMKNNAPECVLLSPEEYIRLMSTE